MNMLVSQVSQVSQPSDASAVDTNRSPPIVGHLSRLATSSSINGSVASGMKIQDLKVYCIRFIRLLLVGVV
jgi:hypothetical protein